LAWNATALRPGVRVAFFKARDDDGVERAFGSAAKQRVKAIVGFDCADLMSRLDLIAAFSLRYRLPVIYQFNEFPRLGGS